MFQITDKFKNLKPEKQDKILRAAFREFGDYGYENASTNRIVKEAGIGKGMLFYYFENKLKLYQDIFEYGLGVIKEQYLNKVNENEADFIEKYKQLSELKMKAYVENTEIFNFFGTLYLENEERKLSEEQEKMMADIRILAHEKINKNIDTSFFRKDIPADQVMKAIQISFLGYENMLTNQLKKEKLSKMDYKRLWDEFYEFLEIMRKVYYE